MRPESATSSENQKSPTGKETHKKIVFHSPLDDIAIELAAWLNLAYSFFFSTLQSCRVNGLTRSSIDEEMGNGFTMQLDWIME